MPHYRKLYAVVFMPCQDNSNRQHLMKWPLFRRERPSLTVKPPPVIIVIGSIYARCEALLRDAAIAAVEKESLRISRDSCRIVPSGLGEALGDYAALAVAEDITFQGKEQHDHENEAIR